MVWALIVATLVAWFIASSFRIGPQLAIGIVVPVAFLFPAWLIVPVFEGARDSIVGTGPDIKVTVGSCCLILYCFMPGATFPLKFVPSDIAMLSLIVIHIISDFTNAEPNWLMLGRAYAEWYMPYVAGRLAMQSRDVAFQLARIMMIAGMLIALTAIIESSLDWNLFELMFGNRPIEGSSRDAERWGVQRAYGPTMHPIYFGVLQLLLLGWGGYPLLKAIHRRAKWGWVLTPVPLMLGVAATGSRGPILGVVASGVAGLFCFAPKLRVWIGGGLITLAGLGIANQEAILDQMERWSGERQHEILIDGELRKTSSVRTRVNLLEVNKIALKRSGWLGFGSQAVAGFPINVPLGPAEVETLKRVKFIDNTYVLITLRFGYLGVLAFLVAALVSLAQFLWVGDHYRGGRVQWLSGCLGAATFGALLVQATVWMPHEVGFPLVWSFGLSASLLVAHLQGKLSA